jgi:hypothetical protein
MLTYIGTKQYGKSSGSILDGGKNSITATYGLRYKNPAYKSIKNMS